MNLPNGDNAIIDARKITEYCLSPLHEDGQHKLCLFDRLIGIGPADAQLLLDALKSAAAVGEAAEGVQDKYGRRYVVDFEMAGQTGKATVRSAWIIRTQEDAPRLVTCYIL